MAIKVSVDALARLAKAREIARITGRKPPLPSLLEQAAEVWKAQQEQRDRLLFPPGSEASVVALQRVPLQPRASGHPTDGEVPWRPQRWGDEGQPRRVKVNAAMVGALALNLRAREWARAMGKTRARRSTFSLEKWAETWRRDKERVTRNG